VKREKERVREMEGGQSKEKSEIFSVGGGGIKLL